MEFLYFLESIRIPVLNELMLLITHLGEETAFLAIGIIVFWCVDKYHGYYLMGVGLFGNLANQFLKILCRIPRPWVRDPNFYALEKAIPEAGVTVFPAAIRRRQLAPLVALLQRRRTKSFARFVLPL